MHALLLSFFTTAAALSFNTPTVRRVVGRDLINNCFPVAELCAEAILSATERNDKAILTSALERDLRSRLGGGRQTALLVLEDGGNVVGSCALEVSPLSPQALDERRLGRQASLEADMAERPMLSSLAISPGFRRKGLAQKLCREAESLAKDWGYEEVLLKVERDNGRARNLYRKLGYRVVAVDNKAERPEAGPGGVRYVPTVQVAMRKDLVLPPLDVVGSASALLAGVAYGGTQYGAELAQAAAMLRDGDYAAVLQLAYSAIPPVALEALPFG